jgi:hypothetical protein
MFLSRFLAKNRILGFFLIFCITQKLRGVIKIFDTIANGGGVKNQNFCSIHKLGGQGCHADNSI